MTTTITNMKAGQPVTVRAISNSGVVQPEFDGVFLGYWRNGRYWVRGVKHGTCCTYRANEIHPRQEGS